MVQASEIEKNILKFIVSMCSGKTVQVLLITLLEDEFKKRHYSLLHFLDILVTVLPIDIRCSL